MPKSKDEICVAAEPFVREVAEELSSTTLKKSERQYILKTKSQLTKMGVSQHANRMSPEIAEEIAKRASKSLPKELGMTRKEIHDHLLVPYASRSTRLSHYVGSHMRETQRAESDKHNKAKKHLEERKVGPTVHMSKKKAKQFVEKVENLYNGKLKGMTEEQAKAEIRRIFEQHDLLHVYDLTIEQLRYHVDLEAEKLLEPILCKCSEEEKDDIKQNTIVALMLPIFHLKAKAAAGEELLQEGKAFVDELWDEEVSGERWCKKGKDGAFMLGLFVLSPDLLPYEMCQGQAFLQKGDYAAGVDQEDKTTDGNYLVDLIGARVYDLKSEISVPGLGDDGGGGYGIPILGNRIMREIAYTPHDGTEDNPRRGHLQVMIRDPDGNEQSCFSLHRFVALVANALGVSIFSKDGFLKAGLDIRDPKHFDKIFSYRPLSDHNAGAIRRAQRVQKGCSRQCDIDHWIGRSSRWAHGILYCGPVSHRMNACLIYARRLVGDWCYALQGRSYMGAFIIINDIWIYSAKVIDDMRKEAGDGVCPTEGLQAIDEDTMRRVEVDWAEEDGAEDATWEVDVIGRDTIKNKTIQCEGVNGVGCNLVACCMWHSPGKDDWFYCLECSKEDGNKLTKEDAEDSAHWAVINKFCSKNGKKKRKR